MTSFKRTQRKYVQKAYRVRTAVLVGGLGEWLGAEDLKGATERFAKRCDLEARPRARLLEETAAVFDLRLEILLAIARRFELFLGDALPLLVKVCLLDLPHEALGIAVADTLTQPALDVVIDHLSRGCRAPD